MHLWSAFFTQDEFGIGDPFAYDPKIPMHTIEVLEIFRDLETEYVYHVYGNSTWFGLPQYLEAFRFFLLLFRTPLGR